MQARILAMVALSSGALALAAPVPMRPVSFEERVRAREAIERVFDSHRIWPKENPGPKPSFEERMPRAVIEEKVRDDLRKGAALERYWRRPVTTAQLQAEIDRMARDSKDPAMLEELFRALGNDPVLVAECLARPVLTERLLHEWYAGDRGLQEPLDDDDGRGDFTSWWQRVGRSLAVAPPAVTGIVEIPGVRLRGPRATCGWIGASGLEIPDGRAYHSAVWTGAEMIVWGGSGNGFGAAASGGRYDPATDTWRGTSTGGACPEGRRSHTSVWTGTEMIVWGGDGGINEVNTGGRYDPITDAWIATSTAAGCPSVRAGHVAVWTGTEMIVWGGGYSGFRLDDGGRYAPASDSWSPTNMLGPLSARSGHVAVWTGSEMIVWGGFDGTSSLNTGARYVPASDTWATTAIAGAPTGRASSSAVWTGSEMIVWGGGYSPVDTGGRYDPVADAWTPTSTAAGCPTARSEHVAVWTGSEMIVWGGRESSSTYTNTGARYAPATDSWTATSDTGACPSGRNGHGAIWTGAEMIVWGGFDGTTELASGGRYAPGGDVWVPTSIAASRPVGRYDHTAVWTGTEMIVWGGQGADYEDSGGRYVPATDSWSATTTGPTARGGHTAVWTGTEMIVWGGRLAAFQNTGARYDPALGGWTATSTGAGCPAGRRDHTAVWTGSEMIVWGGSAGSVLDTGGRYAPATDTWLPTATGGACPSVRQDHTAVWTGNEMIIWGGWGNGLQQTGGRYSPANDTWIATSTAGACPSGRFRHTAVWTGSEMIVWGGGWSERDTGGRYDAASDSWAATATGAGCPSPRIDHGAVWTGTGMVVWGGSVGNSYLVTGGTYDPTADAWMPMPTSGSCPPARAKHTTVWTGTSMIPWGGLQLTSTGGIYVPVCNVIDFLVGAGLGATNPPQVKLHTSTGGATPVDYAAYGVAQWGANVAAGDVNGGTGDEILTGPGPGDVFGPHVRGWDRAGTSLGKVSFYAYGTLKFGVNVASGDIDGDVFEEVLTGAGPGSVFGPHVRAFDYDNATLAAIAKVNFFAYGTLQYGANAAGGSVDADPFAEIATGPGPGPTFAPQVRGFDYDAFTLRTIAKLNYVALPFSGYGVNLALGDVDADGYSEIAVAAGPGPLHPARFVGHDYDGTAVASLPGFAVTAFRLSQFGGRVGLGDVEADGRDDLLCGAGRDPSAGSAVKSYRYTLGQKLQQIPVTLVPFPSLAYGVNVTAGAYAY